MVARIRAVGATAAVLAAGATAARPGTAFLCCDEAGTPHAYREALSDDEKETVSTSAFSGRTARGMRNNFIDAIADKIVLAFPQQNTLTGALRRWAASVGDAGFQSVWAGTGHRKIKSLPVAQLMATVEQELSKAATRP